jgi:hypothetical protein
MQVCCHLLGCLMYCIHKLKKVPFVKFAVFMGNKEAEISIYDVFQLGRLIDKTASCLLYFPMQIHICRCVFN